MPRQPGTYAIFNTSEGTIVCRLFEKEAPKTVANFVELAEGKREWTHPVSRKKSKDRLYDGTIFHRVIPDFMIQGGDPAGTGFGGPGYRFCDMRRSLPSMPRLTWINGAGMHIWLRSRRLPLTMAGSGGLSRTPEEAGG